MNFAVWCTFLVAFQAFFPWRDKLSVLIIIQLLNPPKQREGGERAMENSHSIQNHRLPPSQSHFAPTEKVHP